MAKKSNASQRKVGQKMLKVKLKDSLDIAQIKPRGQGRS